MQENKGIRTNKEIKEVLGPRGSTFKKGIHIYKKVVTSAYSIAGCSETLIF